MLLELTEKLITDIILKRKEYLGSKIKRYAVNNFRASDIHECDRYMVHSVLDWKQKALHDEGLQAIFDRGNDEENLVVRDLNNLGFKFIQQQNPIEIKNRHGEVICRGSIDGKILYEGHAIPCEIKSTNMNTFNSINSLDDLQKKPLHRKYLRQLSLYLFGNNAEAGIFIFSNLQGSYKIIPVILDLGECEHILQRLERNWEYVKKKEYPDRIEYDRKICRKCPYAHVCLQEVKNEGAKFIDNEVLESKLERRNELENAVDEYESIDKEIKETFKGIPEVFVGKRWQITGIEKERKAVDTKAMPDEVKKQYEKVTKFWQTKIIEIPK